MKAKAFFWLYLLLALGNIAGHLLVLDTLKDYTKVALMPVLLAYVYESARGRVSLLTLLLCAGLIFSWFGDLALMREGETYFLLGLSSFLLAHLIYSYTFMRSINFQFRIRWSYMIPIILYGCVMLYVLIPVAGGMAGPVVVYAVVICGALVIAVHRQGLVSGESFLFALFGMGLFALSDSLLAWSKFVGPFAGSGALVMLTYTTAQYLIAEGVVRQDVVG